MAKGLTTEPVKTRSLDCIRHNTLPPRSAIPSPCRSAETARPTQVSDSTTEGGCRETDDLGRLNLKLVVISGAGANFEDYPMIDLGGERIRAVVQDRRGPRLVVGLSVWSRGWRSWYKFNTDYRYNGGSELINPGPCRCRFANVWLGGIGP